MASSFLKIFNDHFEELVLDVESVFPENTEIKTAKNILLTVRKANPKLIVEIWRSKIASKYRDHIERGDIQFFLDKDYGSDLYFQTQNDYVMKEIDRLREPVRNMGLENQQKVIKYMQNLTRLADLV